MVIAAFIIGGVALLWRLILPVVLPVIFTAYLLYGFIRPRISHQARHEIEEEEEDDDEPYPRSVNHGAARKKQISIISC